MNNKTQARIVQVIVTPVNLNFDSVPVAQQPERYWLDEDQARAVLDIIDAKWGSGENASGFGPTTADGP
jgi:hypothetical protein